VVENTPRLHNLVVCTLCSCIRGRCWVCLRFGTSRALSLARGIDPRGVLREFGLAVADDVEVARLGQHRRVALSVLPERPPGSEQ